MKYNRNIWLITILLGCWLGLACVDVLVIENPEGNTASNLVVNGLITDVPGPYYIRIFRTTGRNSLLEEEAGVSQGLVRDNQGNESQLVPIDETSFLLPGKIVQGRVGYEYQLEFWLEDGNQYLSKWELLTPVSTIDSVYFKTNKEERQTGTGIGSGQNFKAYANFYADISLDALPESPYMRWETDRWWMFVEPPRSSPPSKICYISEPPDREGVKLFDGRGITKDHWLREPLGSVEIDWRFHYKTYFQFIQYSLSEEAFRYWSRLDKVIDQTGGIFDSPPAAVVGNVRNVNSPYEQVLGYFGASATDTVFRPVWRQDLPAYVPDPCIYPYIRYQFGGVSPCTHCLVIPNSTLERPYYW